jgi:hypothetical protein
MSNRIEATFFVSKDLRAADELRGKLFGSLRMQHLQFCDRNTKVIFLPASEPFPQWNQIQIQKSGLIELVVWEHIRGLCSGSWSRRTLDSLQYKFILGEARARTHRKMLPSYTHQHSVFRGYVRETSVQVSVEAVTEAPEKMNGVFLTISAALCGEDALERLIQCVTEIDHGAYRVSGSLYTLLRGEDRDYPFLWEQTPVRILTRGSNCRSQLNLNLEVHQGATVFEVLEKAGVNLAEQGLRLGYLELEDPYTTAAAHMGSVVKENWAVVLHARNNF